MTHPALIRAPQIGALWFIAYAVDIIVLEQPMPDFLFEGCIACAAVTTHLHVEAALHAYRAWRNAHTGWRQAAICGLRTLVVVAAAAGSAALATIWLSERSLHAFLCSYVIALAAIAIHLLSKSPSE